MFQTDMKESIHAKIITAIVVRFSLFTLLLFSICAQGQNDKAALEKKKQQILKEIQVAERLLKQGREQEKSVISQIEQQVAKIRLRESLIQTNERKKEIYEQEIITNERQLQKLNVELEVLKKDYANIVLKSYKSRSERSRAMFLLSSTSFLQAYKRAQYMKQYASYRKMQGDEIVEKQEKLNIAKTRLEKNKVEKEKVLVENQKEKELLEEQKKEQEKLAKEVQKNKKKYLSLAIRFNSEIEAWLSYRPVWA